MEIKMIPCECPCGTLIPEYDKWGKKRRFAKGHQSRGINHADVSGEKNPMYGKRGENNPNYGKTHSKKSKQLMSDSHIGIQSGEKNPMFGKHHSPETKQKIKENRRDYIGKNNPMFGKTSPRKGTKLSDETKRLISINHADVSGENNPMFGKRGIETSMYGQRGELSPTWKGGISKEPYCQEFDKWLKEEIKERDNNHCQNPDCIKEITKTNQLCVHHINYIKKDCSANNLITICRSCNNKANYNREHWKNLYSNIIANFVLYREACPL